MIARISSGRSPAGAVLYNEEKIGRGGAVRLAVRNFEGISLPDERLTATLVATALAGRASLNERLKRPTFHVSLALAKGELVSPNELLAMADQYMLGMGYGRQPYAIYQHHDTAHPHVHIVSVRIDETGKTISDRFEREKSNKLRQQIEQAFGLQIAEQTALRPQRTELQPVQHGKGDLKRDISNIVQGVLTHFTFSSFSQYNQLLNRYRVQATQILIKGRKSGQLKPDQTGPGQVMPGPAWPDQAWLGLKYAVIDANGIQQGSSINASRLPYGPTWQTVERRMRAGEKIKGDRVASFRRVVEGQVNQSQHWDELGQRLARLGIDMSLHVGKDGRLLDITYFDTNGRTIYSGSELGKAFTAIALKQKLSEYTLAPTDEPKLGEKQQVENESVRRPTLTSHQPLTAQRQAVGEGDIHLPRHSEESPNHSLETVRQLLQALGENSAGTEGDEDLKRMLKKSRVKHHL